VYLLKRALCEEESQKDFEREEHWPLKISGKIFSEQNFVAFLCFRETFGARKGISNGNAQHHAHRNIFLSFTLKKLS